MKPHNEKIDPIAIYSGGFLHPSEMTTEERLDELAHIFGVGILRLKAGILTLDKKSQKAGAEGNKSLQKTESCLEDLPDKSVYAPMKKRIE